jgi:hypothetical protein
MLSSAVLDSILTFLGLICALHKILSEEGLFHTDFKKALYEDESGVDIIFLKL